MPEPARLAASLTGSPDLPVLVLGNSLGTTRDVWQPQLAALGRHFRLLRYEHRGHGGSPAPPGPYRIAELAGDVLRLLEDCGIQQAAYCGVSLGAMVGMWLAAHAPGRITSLGLCCTSAYLPPADAWLLRAAQVRAAGMAPIADAVVSRWFTPAYRASNPAVPAAFQATLCEADPEGYAGCCEAIATMDLRPILPAISVPTLVIAGAEDLATPPWHGAAIAQAIPGARLRVIRRAAHLATFSASAEVTTLLTTHLPPDPAPMPKRYATDHRVQEC